MPYVWRFPGADREDLTQGGGVTLKGRWHQHASLRGAPGDTSQETTQGAIATQMSLTGGVRSVPSAGRHAHASQDVTVSVFQVCPCVHEPESLGRTVLLPLETVSSQLYARGP